MAMKILRSPFPPVGIRLLHSFPLYHLTSVFASFPYWFWATELIVLYVTSSGKERQFVHALCWISACVGELIVRIQAKCRVERCCASVLVLSAISDPELSFSMGLLGYFMASYCELLPAMAQIVHVYPTCIYWNVEHQSSEMLVQVVLGYICLLSHLCSSRILVTLLLFLLSTKNWHKNRRRYVQR